MMSLLYIDFFFCITWELDNNLVIGEFIGILRKYIIFQNRNFNVCGVKTLRISLNMFTFISYIANYNIYL